jgi:hypothetical protein
MISLCAKYLQEAANQKRSAGGKLVVVLCHFLVQIALHPCTKWQAVKKA